MDSFEDKALFGLHMNQHHFHSQDPMFGVLYVAKPSLCSAVACSEIQVGGAQRAATTAARRGGGACGVRRRGAERGRCAQARYVNACVQAVL